MGMAASQARLLSITARLTDNENSGQSISYSKQRLSDQTQQITNEYNEALSATKLTVLTGFNGASANYEDISYNLMTGMQMAETTKQYVVTDTKGRILVTDDIAKAYEKSNGNYNTFLAAMGYSQADITVNMKTDTGNVNENGLTDTQQQIHEAWDKYFASVGINLGDNEHDFGFAWVETYSLNEKGEKEYNIGDGYTGYLRTNDDGIPVDKDGNLALKTNEDGKYVNSNGETIKCDRYSAQSIEAFEKAIEDGIRYSKHYFNNDGTEASEDNYDYYLFYDNGSGPDDEIDIKYEYKTGTKYIEFDDYSSEKLLAEGVIDENKSVYDPIIYEGTTEESRNLYDYAMAITEAYLRVGKGENGVEFKTEYDMSSIKSAANPDNASAIQYYRNIFNKIQSSGYFTYTNTPAEVDDNHLYTSEGTGTKGNVKKNPLYDNYTFEAALRDGSLRLEYYSSTDKAFKSTTISQDNCIQEVSDERAISQAETKYNQDMADLENKDKKLDLELNKLDTEHNALQTEYESVKNVVEKNVESSFKTFG